eukprot:COSAG01_NODE_1662_length_9555_cov_32.392718_4_plen_72_part_00
MLPAATALTALAAVQCTGAPVLDTVSGARTSTRRLCAGLLLLRWLLITDLLTMKPWRIFMPRPDVGRHYKP